MVKRRKNNIVLPETSSEILKEIRQVRVNIVICKINNLYDIDNRKGKKLRFFCCL
jgi:hypothetical protein